MNARTTNSRHRHRRRQASMIRLNWLIRLFNSIVCRFLFELPFPIPDHKKHKTHKK